MTYNLFAIEELKKRLCEKAMKSAMSYLHNKKEQQQ